MSGSKSAILPHRPQQQPARQKTVRQRPAQPLPEVAHRDHRRGRAAFANTSSQIASATRSGGGAPAMLASLAGSERRTAAASGSSARSLPGQNVIARLNPVLMSPGCTSTNSTRYSPGRNGAVSSIWSAAVNTLNAAFAALYAAPKGSGSRAASDVTLITRPPGCARIAGSASWISRIGPKASVSNCARSSSGGSSSARAEPAAARVVDEHVEPSARFRLRPREAVFASNACR